MGYKKTHPKKEHKSFEAMVKCPVCKAFMYPMAFEKPENDSEKNVVICSSCKRNIAPFLEMDAMIMALEEADRGAEEAKKKEEESGVE